MNKLSDKDFFQINSFVYETPPTMEEIHKKTGLCIKEEYDSQFLTLTNSAAVYIIYLRSGERYVGQSVNVRKRMWQHVDGFKFEDDDIEKMHLYETCKFCLDYLEAWLIYNIKPELNKIRPTHLKLCEMRYKFLYDKIKYQLSRKLYDDAISSTADYIIEKHGLAKTIFINEKPYIISRYDTELANSTILSIKKFGRLLDTIYESEKQQDIRVSWGMISQEYKLESSIYEARIFNEIIKKTLETNTAIITKKAPNPIKIYTIKYINNENCLFKTIRKSQITLDSCLKCAFHKDGDNCEWHEYKTIIIHGYEKHVIACARCRDEIIFSSLEQYEGNRCKKCGLYHMYISKGLFAINESIN